MVTEKEKALELAVGQIEKQIRQGLDYEARRSF